MTHFDFPVGYHELHKTKIIDYQLNRWHSLGYARLEDIRGAAERIRGLDEFKPEMVRLAEEALAEDRFVNAAFYYRAAEFFALPSDADKKKLYDAFIELFYSRVVAGDNVERDLVPYGDAQLPVLRVAPCGAETRGTIVVHGGFDSFMEEFYSTARFFAEHGYQTVLFEGPGQGGALKKYGLPLSYEWEKPVGAVLDHFHLNDATLLGVSLGGWLCLRAAAFEPRVKRVIASSIAFDYLQVPPKPLQWFARALLHFPRAMNRLAWLKARRIPQARWGLANLLYIFQVEQPIDGARKMFELNERNLHSELVTADVLILTGACDHFIPLKMHHKQVAALTAAHTVTERIFTREDQGQNHCQVGNFGLALATMVEWLGHKAAAKHSAPLRSSP